MTLVSVITPVFNGERCIDQAIASVRSQTFRDFEHIIVDDGSTDGTEEIVKNHLQDSRIRYIRTQRNVGAAAARNIGLAAASSDYVSFLDADDVWSQDFLSEMVNFLNQATSLCVGVFCWADIESKDIGRYSPPVAKPGHYNLYRFMAQIAPHRNGSCLLLKMELVRKIGGFPLTKVGHDSEMLMTLLAIDRQCYLHCLPKSLVSYRHGQESLAMSSMDHRIQSFQRRIERFRPLLPKSEWTTVTQAYMISALARGEWVWVKDKSRELLGLFGISIVFQPYGIRTVALCLSEFKVFRFLLLKLIYMKRVFERLVSTHARAGISMF